ncbi:MAG TPA: ubiquinol-cytochrome C chaperone family protein [Sphingorhabdus sp.]|nr:ubiquinol-cytochrome C chaperone family protein [Sphingorhabdus sp.]
MSLLKRLFGNSEPDPKSKLVPLYNQIVVKARQPHWYIEGKVPDHIDGRFDMVAAILTLVILRLEEGPANAADMAHLTEVFVDDMDGQLREVGIGDMIVGKHIGRIMGAVGGRLGAFREGLADHAKLDGAIQRNIYRAEVTDSAALAHVRQGLLDVERGLASQLSEMIVEGAAKW